MIHSWTRKCFPYSTSGLRSVERVMDINVNQCQRCKIYWLRSISRNIFSYYFLFSVQRLFLFTWTSHCCYLCCSFAKTLTRLWVTLRVLKTCTWQWPWSAPGSDTEQIPESHRLLLFSPLAIKSQRFQQMTLKRDTSGKNWTERNESGTKVTFFESQKGTHAAQE